MPAQDNSRPTVNRNGKDPFWSVPAAELLELCRPERSTVTE